MLHNLGEFSFGNSYVFLFFSSSSTNRLACSYMSWWLALWPLIDIYNLRFPCITQYLIARDISIDYSYLITFSDWSLWRWALFFQSFHFLYYPWLFFVCLFGFYDISTFVGYLIPNIFLYKWTVLFQSINFSISTQFNRQKHFYFKLCSLIKKSYNSNNSV